MKPIFKRNIAALLLAVMLLSALSGCNSTEPVGTSHGSSAETTGSGGTDTTTGSTDTTDGTENPTGTTGDDLTVDPPVSDTEITEPENDPTDVPSEPSGETSDSDVCAHKWSAWTTKDATCTANGTKTRTCSKCNNKETESIAATGHAWDEGKVTTQPASCAEMSDCTYTCKICGKTETAQIQGKHSFGAWEWEEYEYTIDYGKDHPGYVPGMPSYATYTSHRKVHSCTECGYKETDGTADHICKKGSKNHTVTTFKEGTCTVGATMRSTCNICGWYVEYEGRKASHTWVDEEVHLSDYGPYTNELDAVVSECTVCGETSVYYIKGAGFEYPKVSDDFSFTIDPVNDFEYSVTSDDFRLLEHPEWQTVYRNFVYNDDGYVIQFDYIYCADDGTRYVCTVDSSDIPGWFEKFDLAPPLDKYEGMNYRLTYKFWALREDVYPVGWHIGWSG